MTGVQRFVGKARIVVKEPLGPVGKRHVVTLERHARALEAKAEKVAARDPLRQYALRKAACHFRMKALLARQVKSQAIIDAVVAAGKEFT